METFDRQSQSEVLSAALRLIRTHRGLRTGEVADRMNMALRSYEYFESGAGRINLERLHRFAKATDSDPYAILAGLALGSPEFALRCADNKLMTILMVSLQDFDRDWGGAIPALDARTLINAFSRVLTDLGGLAVKREQDARTWLETRVNRLTEPVSPEDE